MQFSIVNLSIRLRFADRLSFSFFDLPLPGFSVSWAMLSPHLPARRLLID